MPGMTSSAPMMAGTMPGATSAAPTAGGTMPGSPVPGMDPSMMPVPDGPWIDADGNPVDVSVVIETSGETSGGTTGGVTGSTGGSGGAAAPTCQDVYRDFKTTDREVCRCGTSADALQQQFTQGQMKLTMGNANMAPACPSPRCVASPGHNDKGSFHKENPSYTTIKPFKVYRTIVAGRGDPSRAWEKAKCKSNQLVACFKAEGRYFAARSCVTPTEAVAAKEFWGADSIPATAPGATTPPMTYKCCSGPTNRFCVRADVACGSHAPQEGAKRYDTTNCNLECETTLTPMSAAPTLPH